MPSRCAHTGDARSPRYARLGGLRSLVRASWRPSACFSMHAQERAPQHASLGALLGAFSQTYAFGVLVSTYHSFFGAYTEPSQSSNPPLYN